MAIKKGAHGSSLPSTVVMRVCTPRNMDADQGRAHPGAFEFTSKDREQNPPQLSVFSEDLTTTKQAKEFVGGANSISAAIAYLKTDLIRAIVVPTGSPSLDVVWDDMFEESSNGSKVRSTKAGSDGHCGIANADIQGVSNAKLSRKRIREDLANIATIRPELICFGINLGRVESLTKIVLRIKKMGASVRRLH